MTAMNDQRLVHRACIKGGLLRGSGILCGASRGKVSISGATAPCPECNRLNQPIPVAEAMRQLREAAEMRRARAAEKP